MKASRRPRWPSGMSRRLVAALLAASGSLAAQAIEPGTGQPSQSTIGPAGQLSGLRLTSTQQRADNLYRQAVVLLRSGRQGEAIATLEQALKLLPTHHESRRAMAQLLAADGDIPAAADLLEQGLSLAPGQNGLRLALARLQLAQGQAALAYRTLTEGLASGTEDEEAESNALLAAALQRLGRHQEAVRHYLLSLRSDPAEPRWLIGFAISLQALGRNQDAAQAYSRALETGLLTPEQQAFIRQQLPDSAP